MAPMTEGLSETIDESIAESEATAPEGARQYRARIVDYAIILKPRVMSLVVFVGLVGLLLAPGAIAPWTGAIAVACIAFGAGASGAINMWYDRDIDLIMGRTRDRPIPSGRMAPAHALIVGVALSTASIATMAVAVNLIAAGLLAVTVLYYVFIYTVWLKRRTPQNIVFGGVAGALPPVIGWAAVTGTVSLESLSLFAIIFLWTPPHSWALALFSNADYTRAGVPMLPVVAGERETKRQMLIYTALMIAATYMPVIVGLSGVVYGVAATVLGAGFVHHAVRVWRDKTDKAARPMFGYSIVYLFLIFVFLLVDRALPIVL